MAARALPLLALLYISGCTGLAGAQQRRPHTANEVPAHEEPAINLGKFSISLAVKDLATSREFYETLGFEMIAGVPEENWILLKNGAAKVGLFQGMFDGNLLTFNPTDARAVESLMEKAGYKLETTTSGDTGPTSFIVKDPDGNTLLVDQF